MAHSIAPVPSVSVSQAICSPFLVWRMRSVVATPAIDSTVLCGCPLSSAMSVVENSSAMRNAFCWTARHDVEAEVGELVGGHNLRRPLHDADVVADQLGQLFFHGRLEDGWIGEKAAEENVQTCPTSYPARIWSSSWPAWAAAPVPARRQ